MGWESQMIYTCNKCLFTFERVGEVITCPDCGKEAIREASDSEKEEFHRNLENREIPN